MDKKMKSKMSKLHKGKPMIDTAMIGKKKGHNKIMKHRPLGIKKSIGRPRKVPHPVNIMDEKDIKPDIGLGSLLLSDSRITREAVRQKTQKNKDKRDDQPIMCNICKRTYKFKSHLDRHMLTHNNHRPHKCVLCTAAFFDSHLLKRHILSHTGKLPFQCHLCQKQFYTKSEHARHLRVHDGEKPYQCKEETKARNPREIVIDDSETTLYSLNTNFDTTTQCVESPVQSEESKSRQLRSNMLDSPVLSNFDPAPKSTPKTSKPKKPANITTAKDHKKYCPLVIKTDVDSLRRVDSLVIDCVIDDDSPKHVVNGGAEIIDCDSDDDLRSNDILLDTKKNTFMKSIKLCPGGNVNSKNNKSSTSNDASNVRTRKTHIGNSCNSSINGINLIPKKQHFQDVENNASESSKSLKTDHIVSFNCVQGTREPRLINQDKYTNSNQEIYDCDSDISYEPKTADTSNYDFNTNRNNKNGNQNLNTSKTSTRNQLDTNNYENIENNNRLSSHQNNSSKYDCNPINTERNNNRSRDTVNRQSFYECINLEDGRVSCDDNDSYLNLATLHDVSSNEHSSKRKSSESQDECDMIGQYIGSKLRKLSDIMRVHAEKLINDVLYQAQLNALSKKSVVAENGIDTRKRSFQLDNLVELPRAYFNRD